MCALRRRKVFHRNTSRKFDNLSESNRFEELAERKSRATWMKSDLGAAKQNVRARER